jgi:prevent-host-death family protein
MIKSIGAYDAKTHLSDLLDRVAGGEEITITRHGRPIARLVPIATDASQEAIRAVSELRSLRQGCRLDGLSWQQLRDEGRK